MKKVNFLVRLDDACATMDHIKWNRLEKIFDKYGIKPMVGIVPDNKDLELIIGIEDADFFNKARDWQNKGWAIALHGFEHKYVTKSGGMNPVLCRSEFSGLSLKEQEEKIEKGYSIFKKNNLSVNYFFAPSHSFDENTVIALRNKTDIRIISDTIGVIPYRFKDFVFVPLQFGKFRNILIPGFWTFCLHPNMMNEIDFQNAEIFIEKHCEKFISFDDIESNSLKVKSNFDKLLSFVYFLRRRIINQYKG